MVAESSPPPTRRVTVDIDAEIAALEAANDRDRQAVAELQARIAGREENATFLRGLLSRVAGGAADVGVVDAGLPAGHATEPVVIHPDRSSGATYVGPKLTQKYMSLSLLDEPPGAGLMAVEIINLARARFPSANPIERTSLSPLLAKMACPKEGAALVTHHKEVNRWSITPAGRAELRRLKGDAE